MKTQPQFPTVQEQIEYWNKKEGEELDRVSRIQEAESRDATNETREVERQRDALLSVCKMMRAAIMRTDFEHTWANYPKKPMINTQNDASNPQEQAATTEKTLTQEEIEEREQATCDWYDENARKYRLVDEGQTFDGEGESYAERNA
jgi:hypothetical protein